MRVLCPSCGSRAQIYKSSQISKDTKQFWADCRACGHRFKGMATVTQTLLQPDPAPTGASSGTAQ
jgi:hypothetical protein